MKYKDSNCGKKEQRKTGAVYTADFYSDGAGEGFIYKNYVAFHKPWEYKDKNEIVYIPEYGFPDSKFDRVPAEELRASYTRQDLIDLTQSEKLAEELFGDLSWQHPETLWDDWGRDSDENDCWIEATWAYEKVYLPEFADGIDRTGQEPVCYDEFFHNEWRDEEYRNYCLDRLVEKEVIAESEAKNVRDIFAEEEMC